MTDLCECGHPHVNPDCSGSCSSFLCPCRVFRNAASNEGFCPDDPACGCAAGEPCKRDEAMQRGPKGA